MARDDNVRTAGGPTRLRRMSKQQRREQLIARALTIIAAEGSEALTLARLAHECGVTKPIAYQHFGTRSGLMIALYRELGDGPSDAAANALRDSASGALSLTEAIRLCAKAYIETALDKGTLYTSISAALMLSAGTKRITLSAVTEINKPACAACPSKSQSAISSADNARISTPLAPQREARS